MADIKFVAQVSSASNIDGTPINHGAGSGLGFYGEGYGVSVPVGQTQQSTWVTNENGTESSLQYDLHNTRNIDPDNDTGDGDVLGKVGWAGESAIPLNKLANYKAPLNIRFTHTEAVKVQSCKLRIFDRNNIKKHASGVTTYVFEVRHPAITVSSEGLTHRGTTGHYWSEFDSAATAEPVDMVFTSSPGISGINTSTADEGDASKFTSLSTTPPPTFLGNLHSSQRHDWYVALSALPTEIGSKTHYGLYFTLEYL